MLTEVLLDVTNEEIDSVASEALEEEKKLRFVFKEPKFKPKRIKPAPGVLGESDMWCSFKELSHLPPAVS